MEEPDGLGHYIAVEKKRKERDSLVMKLDGRGYLHDIHGGSNHLILGLRIPSQQPVPCCPPPVMEIAWN